MLEEVLPWLCLKGISTGAMHEAIETSLGPEAKGLSAARRSLDSNPAGRMNARHGVSEICPANATCASGSTECASTSAWTRPSSAIGVAEDSVKDSWLLRMDTESQSTSGL